MNKKIITTGDSEPGNPIGSGTTSATNGQTTGGTSNLTKHRVLYSSKVKDKIFYNQEPKSTLFSFVQERVSSESNKMQVNAKTGLSEGIASRSTPAKSKEASSRKLSEGAVPTGKPARDIEKPKTSISYPPKKGTCMVETKDPNDGLAVISKSKTSSYMVSAKAIKSSSNLDDKASCSDLELDSLRVNSDTEDDCSNSDSVQTQRLKSTEYKNAKKLRKRRERALEREALDKARKDPAENADKAAEAAKVPLPETPEERTAKRKREGTSEKKDDPPKKRTFAEVTKGKIVCEVRSDDPDLLLGQDDYDTIDITLATKLSKQTAQGDEAPWDIQNAGISQGGVWYAVGNQFTLDELMKIIPTITPPVGNYKYLTFGPGNRPYRYFRVKLPRRYFQLVTEEDIAQTIRMSNPSLNYSVTDSITGEIRPVHIKFKGIVKDQDLEKQTHFWISLELEEELLWKIASMAVPGIIRVSTTSAPITGGGIQAAIKKINEDKVREEVDNDTNG